MDTLARLTVLTRARRALLNDTIAALPRLFGGRGVALRIYDPLLRERLRLLKARPPLR